MSITTIADPTVRLVASKKLCTFVGTAFKANHEMPTNIAEIFRAQTGRTCSMVVVESADGVENVKYTAEEEQFLRELELDEASEAEFKELIAPEDSDDEETEDSSVTKKKDGGKPKQRPLINLKDVKWLDQVLQEKRKNGETDVYLHELLENCELVLPENEVLERSPELEARCQKLRQKQEEYLYHKMTRNVDNSFKDSAPEDSISFQMKMMNRQLIAVAQFVFSVLAGFAFGFIGVDLIIGGLDFGFRLLLGIIIALVIALAEIYFLAKRLSEDAVDKDDMIRTMKTPTGGEKVSPKKTVTPGAVKAHQE